MKMPVVLQQKIIHPAVKPHRRPQLRRTLLRQRFQIVRPAKMLRTKNRLTLRQDRRKLLLPRLLLPHRRHHRPRVRIRRTKHLRIFERQFQRPIPAHRQPPDRSPLPPRNRRKCPVHKPHHIFDNVILIRMLRIRMTVRIPSPQHARHHHDHRYFRDKPLHVAPSRPHRMVIRQSVQKIINRKRPSPLLRQKHVHRRCVSHRVAKKSNFRQCHKMLPCSYANELFTIDDPTSPNNPPRRSAMKFPYVQSMLSSAIQKLENRASERSRRKSK